MPEQNGELQGEIHEETKEVQDVSKIGILIEEFLQGLDDTLKIEQYQTKRGHAEFVLRVLGLEKKLFEYEQSTKE